MNHTSHDSLTFTMPLTLKAHQLANQFRQQQPNPQKGKQVYLNTLAVQAVQAYLSWFDIATELEASDSWNPVMQALADTADLAIPGKGKLECRPVLPDTQICGVPPEVWSGRIGYVAVQFDPALSEATLLGFMPAVSQPEVPLTEWRSLDELLDALLPAQAIASAMPPISLSQWLLGVMQMGWQVVEDRLELQQPAWNFRGSDLVQFDRSPIIHEKRLDLTSAGDRESISLLVGILPGGESMLDIWVKVCPAQEQLHLPPALELMVLDAVGIPVMQAQSRDTEMIQLKFKGTLGEKFSVKVILGDQSITEFFVV